MTRLIFLGPPGAGKGTQAHILAQELEIPHVSTGDILRNAKAAGTELGLKAKSYMDRGELVPDALILDLVRDRLTQTDAQSGWILDGFPRNVSQATFLDELLQKLDQVSDYVLNLEVADEVLVDRMLERGRKQGRTDDTEEVIRHRLEVYRNQTAPLIDFYKQRQQLVSIDGDRSLEEVTSALKQVVHS
ncbi:adenylate kinase [Coleofasciculus sp. FACHB-64]|uniref:adenylate kinase n=1 Tax=Cyanophyceae TaxID=3028117 RepID=UPI0016879791|nr:adenylate kinase [Coleofasciculus sp. FACHB-501]MBD1881648.1 adenylate kinase [Coleofasciculus sp. FACHB-T130]MBD2044288.1 adenylate kinase [Coleofasciculus sp. FACHB-64]MBD2087839.1 adenylate kinase [Coleofasciculus sp. FACHB-542]